MSGVSDGHALKLLHPSGSDVDEFLAFHAVFHVPARPAAVQWQHKAEHVTV